MSDPEIRSSITIKAPAAVVWSALTTPDLIKRWFFGVDTETDWKVGSPIVHRGTYQGRPYVDKGEITTFEPPRVLAHTHWSDASGKPDDPANYQHVTWTLEERAGSTVLTVTEENLPSADAKEVSERSWATVLTNLKDLLEARRRDRYPPGVPCWIDVEPADPADAMRFYAGLFGWTFDDTTPPGSRDRYAVARLGGDDVAGIGLAADGATSPAAWNTYVCVDSVEAALRRVLAGGGRVLGRPHEMPGAALTARCADPGGATFRLWEPRGHNGVQRANEDGTWNMNQLATPDLEAAKRFYGTVFGWVVDVVHFGDQVGHMIRMPGYGDFLEQFDPEIRQRQAEAGVPPGYEDAVAWMSEVTGDAAGEPASWGITFAVDDTDAVAARASSLGGTVVVPPFDAGPGVRLAVLTDPAGATLTVNRYQAPE